MKYTSLLDALHACLHVYKYTSSPACLYCTNLIVTNIFVLIYTLNTKLEQI